MSGRQKAQKSRNRLDLACFESSMTRCPPGRSWRRARANQRGLGRFPRTLYGRRTGTVVVEEKAPVTGKPH
jgi:hypothetical protein